MCVQCYAISSALLIFYRVFPLLHSSARLFNKLKLLNQNKNKKKGKQKKDGGSCSDHNKKNCFIWWFYNFTAFWWLDFFFVALNKTAKASACITTEISNNIQCIAGQLKVFLNHAVENICLNVSLPVSCVFFFLSIFNCHISLQKVFYL